MTTFLLILAVLSGVYALGCVLYAARLIYLAGYFDPPTLAAVIPASLHWPGDLLEYIANRFNV